jgi:hypothetical protein
MIFSAKPNKLTNTSLPSSTAGALLGVLSMVWCTFTRTYTKEYADIDRMSAYSLFFQTLWYQWFPRKTALPGEFSLSPVGPFFYLFFSSLGRKHFEIVQL